MAEGNLNVKYHSSNLLEALKKDPPNYCASPYGSNSDLTSTREEVIDMLMFQREEFIEDKPIRDILHAIHIGDVSTVSSQLTSDMANHRCNSGWCLAHYAAYHGQPRIVDILCERGARFAEKTKNGHLPIHLAAWRGQSEVVSLLLKQDASMSKAISENDYTPLHWAAMEGHQAVIEALVSAGALVNAKSTNGSTALHFAAQNGHNMPVMYLLDKGANPNEQNELGDTPLHCATWKGLKTTVELLLRYKGDPSIKNKEGKKPVQELKGRATDLIRVLHMAEKKKASEELSI